MDTPARPPRGSTDVLLCAIAQSVWGAAARSAPPGRGRHRQAALRDRFPPGQGRRRRLDPPGQGGRRQASPARRTAPMSALGPLPTTAVRMIKVIARTTWCCRMRIMGWPPCGSAAPTKRLPSCGVISAHAVSSRTYLNGSARRLAGDHLCWWDVRYRPVPARAASARRALCLRRSPGRHRLGACGHHGAERSAHGLRDGRV